MFVSINGKRVYPTVGFIVTNLTRPARRVVAFYNQRGTAEQHIKEGKNAIVWTRLSCRKFQNNAVRLQLHALAYNLGNFMRTLALPEAVKQWSVTSLREKLVKIRARIVTHGRYVTFQLAEVAAVGRGDADGDLPICVERGCCLIYDVLARSERDTAAECHRQTQGPGTEI